jgi:hypothetical protein
MQDKTDDLVRQLHREEVDRQRPLPSQLATPPIAQTVPATQLPEGPTDSPIATEWRFYRGIVSRLLAEGYEGKWLLIKNEEIVGIWDTEDQANAVRLERFARQPVLMKQILAREPVLRIGYNRLCRS